MSDKQIMPVAAVSVCVVRTGRVLLAQRANPRAYGLWSLPGGHVEYGEPVRAAATRELKEETGIEASLVRLLDCVDIIHRDVDGAVKSHYVLSVFGARWISGKARASSDAKAVAWVRPDDLDGYKMTPGTAELIRRVVPELTEI